MQACNNFSSDICIDKVFRKHEMFSKDIQLSITSDEPDERDRPIGDIIDLWQTKFGRRQDGGISSLLNDLERSLAFKATIPMVLVVEEFEVLGLGSELTIAPKPLPSKESPVVGVIKALHDAIAPRFSDRDEDHLDSQQQTEPEDNAKGARVTIASTKTKFVVDLKKVGDSYGFPATNEA
jgi:hypothetical protein